MSTERELSDDVIAMIEADLVKPIVFMFFDFPSMPQRTWTGQGPITFSGHTWQGVGGAIAIDTVTETTDTAAKGMQATVNGLDMDFANRLKADNYQGCDAVLYLAFFNSTEDIIYTLPGPWWEGFMDSDSLTFEEKTANIQVKCEHGLVDILRKREWQYNDQDQQALFPGRGDTGLSRIPTIQDYPVLWGRTQT